MRRTTNALVLVLAMLLVLALPPGAAHAQKKTLVVALNQDPDILDPTLSRTYVGRIVYAQMCEKLYDIDEGLRIFPQLAADLPTFTDGGKTVTIKPRPGGPRPATAGASWSRSPTSRWSIRSRCGSGSRRRSRRSSPRWPTARACPPPPRRGGSRG